MSWNGSGTFSRTKNWVADKAAATGIVATRHDEEDDSFASGIQACVTKNAESKMTAHFQPNVDATYSLGTASLKWISVFLSSSAKFVGSSFTTDVAYTDPTANRTITLPDDTGTAALTKDVLALAGGTMTGTLIQAKGGDLASANPLVIDSDGNYFDVTGTTNFASMTVGAGTFFTLQFDGILTITHHATNLDLPGEADITTAAGDSMICFATGANTVHVLSYTRADGKAVIASSVLVQEVYVEDGAVATGTTVIPLNDSIPQSGEGDQYMSLAITPTDAANDLFIDVVVNSAQSSSSDQTMVALFKDAGADAIAAVMGNRIGVVNAPRVCSFTHKISAGSTSSQTFKVRAGGASGTMTFNGISAGRIFGGVMASSIRIREVTP